MLILPSELLSSSTCLIGMPYFTAVVSSGAYWPKPPSPVTATIGRPGVGGPGARSRPGSRSRSSRGSPTSAPAGPRLEVAAEGVGVVADVDGDDRVRRAGAGRARRTPPPPRRLRRGRRRPGAPSPPARSPSARRRRRAGPRRCGVGDGRRRARRPSSAASPSRSRGRRRRSGRSRCGSSSICTIGLYGAMPVWFENDAPTTTSRSDSFISQLATGVPLRPSTPGAERVGVGDQALGLERGQHRRAEPLGERRDLASRAAGAVADDDHRAARVARPARGARRARRRRAGSGRSASRPAGAAAGCVATAAPAPRRAARGARRRGRRCACLHRERGQLGVVAAGAARSVEETATSAKTADRSRSWNAPRPRHLRRHLAGDRDAPASRRASRRTARSAGWSSRGRRSRSRPPGGR